MIGTALEGITSYSELDNTQQVVALIDPVSNADTHMFCVKFLAKVTPKQVDSYNTNVNISLSR